MTFFYVVFGRLKMIPLYWGDDGGHPSTKCGRWKMTVLYVVFGR